jgi:hypothetical protein
VFTWNKVGKTGNRRKIRFGLEKVFTVRGRELNLGLKKGWISALFAVK